MKWLLTIKERYALTKIGRSLLIQLSYKPRRWLWIVGGSRSIHGGRGSKPIHLSLNERVTNPRFMIRPVMKKTFVTPS